MEAFHEEIYMPESHQIKLWCEEKKMIPEGEEHNLYDSDIFKPSMLKDIAVKIEYCGF